MYRIIILILALGVSEALRAQQSAAVGIEAKPAFTGYSFTHQSVPEQHKKFCYAAKVGLGAMVAGGVACAVGYSMLSNGGNSQFQNSNNGDNALNVLLVGAVLIETGSYFAIIGGIYDTVYNRTRSKKLSLITPGRNEAGVAYNF